MTRREDPAGVEQQCPVPTFCSAWRLELHPHPQPIPWRGPQRAGSACAGKISCAEEAAQAGADGALWLSSASVSVSFSLLTQALHYPHGWTNHRIHRMRIFPPSLLCLNFSPASLCLGTAWLCCSTPSSALRFAVVVGSLWPCVVPGEAAPLRSSLGGAEG